MCKYCEELLVEDEIEEEGYINLEGPSVKAELISPECDVDVKIGCFDVDNSGFKTWFIKFAVDQDWEEKIPVSIGLPYRNTTTIDYVFNNGFDCNEMVEINYCPFCGRELVER